MTEQIQEPRDDWAGLESLWNGEPRLEDPQVQELTRRMRRRATRRRWWQVVEIVLPLAVIGLTIATALKRQEPVWWIAASYAILISVAAWAFRILNRHRKSLMALGAPATVIASARAELEAQQRGVRFGWGLMALHTVFFGTWLAIAKSEGYLSSYLLLAAWLAPFALASIFLQRRIGREAVELAHLEKELEVESLDNEIDQVNGPTSDLRTRE